MDVEVVVRPARGSAECVWVHSLREPPRAAIRVVALSGEVWSRTLRPQLRSAMLLASTSEAKSKKLAKAWRELTNAGSLPPDQVCPTYLLLTEVRGAVANDDTLFYGSIGSMLAAYGMSCEDGNMILAGYGEFGIGPSVALHNGVLRLLAAAKKRSGGIFEEVEQAGAPDDLGATGSTSPTPDADGEDEAEGVSPSPEPTETNESDAEDEDNTIP